MRRRVAIVAAAAMLVALVAASAQAELCAKCKGMVFTTDIGTCKACGGDTSSRAFALCAACSTKLGECEHCRAKLASAAKPAAPADPKAEPAESAEGEVKGYPPLGLTQEAAGKTLAVVAGRKIEIRLASNITTGYSWTVAELTPGPVKQIGKAEYVPNQKAAGMVGVGGTNVFTFVGTAVGKANLRLEYRRPWEKDTPAAKTFAIGLDVKPDPTPERARQLKEGIETFWLELRYWGDQDKPFYSVILQVGELQGEYPPFVEAARLTKDQAARIVEGLAQDGFLALSENRATAGMPTPAGPCYLMTVREKPAGEFCEDLGWNLAMLRRLEALRKTLEGDAAKSLDTLLGRMSGLRKAWAGETAKPADAPQKPR